MSTPARSIVIVFAFANDREDNGRYLRNLPEERRRLHEAVAPAVRAGLCERPRDCPNVTLQELVDVLQDSRGRVAVLHYGGHAGESELFFESPHGAPNVAHSAGIAALLEHQPGLELVFFNGCSTAGQVRGLLDAGVPAVIATSQDIDDEVATEFAARFYRGLASGASLRIAFSEAEASLSAHLGDPTRSYRNARSREVADERWPWELHFGPGAESQVAKWSLASAAGDPLFGLPALPAMDLPPAPFKHLHWFGREDAPIFFGRGREIRELYEAVTAPDGAPIVLLFGASGVGKSSLLAAGLGPRLEATHEVLYLRRDGALGLAGTLARVFGDGTDHGRAWRTREESAGRSLVVVLDQVEEAWTRPLAGEAEALVSGFRSVFAVRDARPRGRLILSFRKEWLAEVLRMVKMGRLPSMQVEVTELGQAGIEEAVSGPASSEHLRSWYRLDLDPELPQLIASDLVAAPGSPIAPTLQVLLTKMWKVASEERPGSPHLSVELYRRLKRQGILLTDFVDEQLKSLAQWRQDLVASGLALDVLAYHTTRWAPPRLAEAMRSRPATAVAGKSGSSSGSVSTDICSPARLAGARTGPPGSLMTRWRRSSDAASSNRTCRASAPSASWHSVPASGRRAVKAGRLTKGTWSLSSRVRRACAPAPRTKSA